MWNWRVSYLQVPFSIPVICGKIYDGINQK